MNLTQIRKFAPQIRQIAQKHGVSRVYVFGSVAREETTATNDVDFLVELQAGASLFGVAGFCFETEQLLNTPVDVIPISLLHQVKDRDFAATIQNEAIAI